MAEGRRRDAWSVISHQMALQANCHRDPKKRAFTAADFNPFESRRNGLAITARNFARVARAMGAQSPLERGIGRTPTKTSKPHTNPTANPASAGRPTKSSRSSSTPSL